MRRIVSLTMMLGALVSVLSCGAETEEPMSRPEFSIEFRLAVHDGSDECDGCSSFFYEGVLGESETVLADIEPDLVLEPAQLRGVSASTDPEGFGVMIIADEEGAAQLSELAEGASEKEIILVSVRDQSLGTFSPSLLKASHGYLGFSFSREERFRLVLEALGGEHAIEHIVGASNDEEWMEVCARISDIEERNYCERNTWTQLRREKESLRRVKQLLESGTEKDYDAAVDEMLKE